MGYVFAVCCLVRFSGPFPELSGGQGASGSGALGGGGFPSGNLVEGISEGSFIRLAAGFKPGAADLKASPLPLARPVGDWQDSQLLQDFRMDESY